LVKSTKFNYAFTKAGVYNLTLVVNDSKGGIDTTQWVINVTEPILYGTVYDTDTGLPLADINISVYNASVYDVFNDTGDYSALQPKEIPDTITDKYGNYLIAGPLASWAQAHLVLQGSDEKDFNIYIEKGKKKRHDCYLDEDRPETKFNAEGHILYSGKYEHSNNYTCGDNVKFVMFGVNSGDTNETITFNVQDHTSIGGPTAPIVYNGSISNPSESLTVPAGEKVHKTFEFTIPCSYSTGRYDIHVVWNNDTWHKIGNFFVVEDTTPPYINSYPAVTSGYRTEPIPINFTAHDPAQEGTVRAYEEMSISSASNYLTVQIDKDITTDSDNDNITDNDADYIAEAGSLTTVNLTYNESGHYTARFIVTDSSGNTAYDETNVTVYITEADADVIGDAIYSSKGFLSLNHDYNYTSTKTTNPINYLWDRFDDLEVIGDEYLTQSDTLNSIQVSQLNEVIYSCTGPEYIKPIYSMITDEYNYTLDSFLYNLDCRCGEFLSINCSARHFSPEIWKCSPGDGYNYIPCIPTDQTIPSTGSINFTISVVDPNNDPFSIYWYDDGNLVAINTTSYLFVADNSSVGNHTIKVIALDSTGENISIENGPHNSWEWKLTVTE